MHENANGREQSDLLLLAACVNLKLIKFLKGSCGEAALFLRETLERGSTYGRL